MRFDFANEVAHSDKILKSNNEPSSDGSIVTIWPSFIDSIFCTLRSLEVSIELMITILPELLPSEKMNKHERRSEIHTALYEAVKVCLIYTMNEGGHMWPPVIGINLEFEVRSHACTCMRGWSNNCFPLSKYRDLWQFLLIFTPEKEHSIEVAIAELHFEHALCSFAIPIRKGDMFNKIKTGAGLAY